MKTDMNTAPPSARATSVRMSRALRRNVFRMASSAGRGESAQMAYQAVDVTAAVLIRDAGVAQRLLHRHADTPEDRHRGRDQRDEEPHRDLHPNGLERHQDVADIEVEQAGGEPGQPEARQGRERDGDRQGEHGVCEDEREVQRGDLLTRAPTAFMIPIWRVCWVMITATVFATRRPDTIRLRRPIPPRTMKIAWRSSLAGCLPGSGTSAKVTG